MEAADESLVQIVFEIRRQDEQAWKIFDALEKIADLLIRILVVRALNVGALAEQGVGLVEEQNPILGFRPFEDAFEILLRLTDVFGNDLGQIDAIHVSRKLLAEKRGGERFAGSGRSIKQDAVTGFYFASQIFVFIQQVMVVQPNGKIIHLPQRLRMQYGVFPSHQR